MYSLNITIVPLLFNVNIIFDTLQIDERESNSIRQMGLTHLVEYINNLAGTNNFKGTAVVISCLYDNNNSLVFYSTNTMCLS